jgi:hypothetical protein
VRRTNQGNPILASQLLDLGEDRVEVPMPPSVQFDDAGRIVRAPARAVLNRLADASEVVWARGDHNDVGGDSFTERFVRLERLAQAGAAASAWRLKIGLVVPGEVLEGHGLAEELRERLGVCLREGATAVAMGALDPRVPERDVRKSFGFARGRCGGLASALIGHRRRISASAACKPKGDQQGDAR